MLPKKLRITGGKLVRHTFFIPPLLEQGVVRPVTHRARESLFASIAPRLVGKKVLDLFAGSGANGFEAISRGASEALLVEQNNSIAQCIKKSIEHLKLQEQAKVQVGDAIAFVAHAENNFYDVIFIDPPYALSLEASFWENLERITSPDTLIIFRAHKKDTPLLTDKFSIEKEKTYGSMRIFWLGKKAGASL